MELITILNILYLISFTCSFYIAISLVKLKKNPLIGIFCCAYCLLCCDVLSSVIFENNLSSAPKAFCFFQAYTIQILCYIISISVLCYTHQTYSLLVNFRRSIESKKIYYALIVMYPVALGIPLFVICLKTDAIMPRELKCDITSPLWIRLIGYSGANFILNLPGTYFSARSAYILYKHLDQFKKFSSTDEISYNSSINSQIVQSPISRQKNPNKERYSMTKEVVIRMFIFSTSIILISFMASINTIIAMITKKPLPPGLCLHDLAGGIMGICTFLIFGFSREVRNLWKFG